MRIVIIGAYGYTGLLICDELVKAGVSFSIAGLNFEKLDQLQKSSSLILDSKLIDVTNSKDCLQIIEENDIIINCAGPFTENSTVLLEFISKSTCSYIDISGEAEFIFNSFEKHHKNALKHGSLIIHGCAFESLIVDLYLQSISNLEEIESLKTYYKFNQKKVSPGTKLTMKLSKLRRLVEVVDSQLITSNYQENCHPLQINLSKFTAIPYPLPEIAFGQHQHGIDNTNSYLILLPDEAKYVTPGHEKQELLKPTLEKIRKKKIKGPNESDRQDQLSEIFIQLRTKDGKESIIQLNSSDMYRTTAHCIVHSIGELKSNKNKFTGVLSPASLFKSKELSMLEALNIQIKSTPDFRTNHE
jgi:short subunit dehydrogenase-like uncharacterized protein